MRNNPSQQFKMFVLETKEGTDPTEPFAIGDPQSRAFIADWHLLEVGETCPAMMRNGHGGTWENEETAKNRLRRIS